MTPLAIIALQTVAVAAAAWGGYRYGFARGTQHGVTLAQPWGGEE